ncbi:MAG: SDR family oxidoreductase [Deltaproteobacteria bacterium]|nr:MAG: SDR family oxidoreductase [Deltaproteobacteria bacterium]
MAWHIADKVCVVTGANSGIGKCVATELARRGARVVMVCRDLDRGAAARAEIEATTGARPELMQCDMASLASIRRFVDDLRARTDRIHVLINNAGAMFDRRGVTADGFERHFGVNHLGYFAVTTWLLDRLVAAAPARVVCVSSMGHRLARLDLDDLQCERRYNRIVAYGNSKLCNILFTYELARRLEGTGVTANCLHPGAAATGFGRSAGPLFAALMKLGRPVLVSAEEAARTPLYLATSPEVDGVTGRYFVKCRPAPSSRRSYDRDLQRRLWDISERLISPYAPAEA